MGEVIRETTSNQKLAKAWSDAIRNEKANRNIDYWKQRLASQQLSRTGMHESIGGNTLANRKRKGTPNFKIPPGYAREEVDDDEGADTFLQPQSDAVPIFKKESSDSMSSSELDALCDEDAVPHSPHTAPSNQRRRLNLTGRCSMRLRTPVENGNQVGSANATSSRACSVSSQSAIRTDMVE